MKGLYNDISLSTLFSEINMASIDEELKYYSLDIEQDYEAIFRTGWRPDPYGECTIPVGTCDRMCTVEEMIERERQRRLSRYETIPGTNPPRVDQDLAMKEYSRSAAGREFTRAMNLRPWSVLKKSLNHILMDISLREDDWMYISGFGFDRLKSIRQDMIIQRIEGSRCIHILEDYTKEKIFNVILSPEGTPVSGLDNYEINVVREMKLTMQCLRDCLHSLVVQYQDYVPNSPNRFLFESINMIVNLPQLLGHYQVGTDIMSKRNLRNSNKLFKTVFHMRKEHLIDNHPGALKHLPDLQEYPLIILTYAFVLPLLQNNLIVKLRRVYASRGPNRTKPEFLADILCPSWLDSVEYRIIFTVFIALQYGIYDDEKKLIDYNLKNKVTDPSRADKIQQILRDRLHEETESDNETRIYALQMIAGREWVFFKETLNLYGRESVLDPNLISC